MSRNERKSSRNIDRPWRKVKKVLPPLPIRRVSDLKLSEPVAVHRIDFSLNQERTIGDYLKPGQQRKVERIRYFRDSGRLFFIFRKDFLPDSIVFTPTNCTTKIFLYEDLPPSHFAEERAIGRYESSFKISDEDMNRLVLAEEVSEFETSYSKCRVVQFMKSGVIKIGFRLVEGNKLVHYGPKKRKRRKDFFDCVVYFNFRRHSVWIKSEGDTFVKNMDGEWEKEKSSCRRILIREQKKQNRQDDKKEEI